MQYFQGQEVKLRTTDGRTQRHVSRILIEFRFADLQNYVLISIGSLAGNVKSNSRIVRITYFRTFLREAVFRVCKMDSKFRCGKTANFCHEYDAFIV